MKFEMIQRRQVRGDGPVGVALRVRRARVFDAAARGRRRRRRCRVAGRQLPRPARLPRRRRRRRLADVALAALLRRRLRIAGRVAPIGYDRPPPTFRVPTWFYWVLLGFNGF